MLMMYDLPHLRMMSHSLRRIGSIRVSAMVIFCMLPSFDQHRVVGIAAASLFPLHLSIMLLRCTSRSAGPAGSVFECANFGICGPTAACLAFIGRGGHIASALLLGFDRFDRGTTLATTRIMRLLMAN